MAAAYRKVDKKRSSALAASAKVQEATSALDAAECEKVAFEKERPYPCTLCEKRFLSKSHFNEHQRVHTGERPFPCPQCDRSFTTQHNLKRHQIIHTKEASYRCGKCGVLFCHVHKNAKTVEGLSTPLTSSKPAYVMPSKKTSQVTSLSKRAKRVQRKRQESGAVTLRKEAGRLQNKIAYDIEVVL